MMQLGRSLRVWLTGAGASRPPLLFKYRSCSTDEEFDRITKILGGELWFPVADQVNDPFEFKCAVDYGYSLQETVKAFTLVELAFNPSITRPEALKKVLGVFERLSDDQIRYRQQELSMNLWNRLASSHSMCCLSATPTSTLLWSHYADSHRGVAIGIRLPENTHPLYQVRYSDKLARLSPLSLVNVGHARQTELFETLFLRKAECWRYESEYRVIASSTKSFARNIGAHSVEQIVFGCSMDKNMKGRIIDWVKQNAPHVRLANANPSVERSYALAVQELA
jgi:Protein of unknown function (DUF2971)